jgi:hypothetical protein
VSNLKHYYGFNHLHYLGLHAQQPGEARVGEGARRLAVVELEVLFSARRFAVGYGQSAVRRRPGGLSGTKGAYIPTKTVGTYAPPAASFAKWVGPHFSLDELCDL